MSLGDVCEGSFKNAAQVHLCVPKNAELMFRHRIQYQPCTNEKGSVGSKRNGVHVYKECGVTLHDSNYMNYNPTRKLQ